MNVFERMNNFVDPMQNLHLMMSHPPVIPMKEFSFIMKNNLRLSHIIFLINLEPNFLRELPNFRIICIHSAYFDLLTLDFVLPLFKINMKRFK